MSVKGRVSKKVEKKVREYFEKLENGNKENNTKQHTNKPRGNS